MRVLTSSFLAAFALAASALAQPPTKSAKPDYKKLVQSRTTGILDSISQESDFTRAAKDLTALQDELIAYAPSTETDAFREADFSLRLITQLSQVKAGRIDLLTYLRANTQLAEALVFQVSPKDKIPGVYDMLGKLREKHAGELNRYASLAAAICVVHDQPMVDHVNENTAKSADPVLIYEFFKSHEKQMHFPLTSTPPEILVFVVDSTASIDDMGWALSKYAGDARINKRYFEVPYDKSYFRGQTEKKVTVAGFSLPSILKNGGVCADQAYFAEHVGKSEGIPTAVITGRNASMGHAWVGFLEVVGGKARWNFDAGHYEGYENVRGSTIDPQTRESVPDSALCLIADTSMSGLNNRHIAVAMTDAALRAAAIQRAKSAGFPPTAETTIPKREPARAADLSTRLELLEAGLRKSPAYAAGWDAIAAAAPEMSLKEKRSWASVLESLCGAKNPDFTLSILTPMVRSIPETKDQDAFWNSLFTTYQKRPDLAAEVRFNQGAMWEKAGEQDKAWGCYEDVYKKFPNAGTFAVDAAQRCERLIKESGKPGGAAALYASIWPLMKLPGAAIAAEFRRQCNWYRIGSLYAASLRAEGNTVKAEEVTKSLER